MYSNNLDVSNTKPLDHAFNCFRLKQGAQVFAILFEKLEPIPEMRLVVSSHLFNYLYRYLSRALCRQVFSEDIKLVRIEAIISELIDMYDMETKHRPSQVDTSQSQSKSKDKSKDK